MQAIYVIPARLDISSTLTIIMLAKHAKHSVESNASNVQARLVFFVLLAIQVQLVALAWLVIMTLEEYVVYARLQSRTVPSVLQVLLAWFALLDLLALTVSAALLVSLIIMEYVQPVLQSALNVDHALLLQHA